MMNSTTRKVVAQIFNSSLSNEPWQDIGFRSRPRYGTLFQRLRPAWRVKLEKSVLKEMIVLFTTAYVLAGKIKINEIDEVVDLYADGYGTVTDLFRTIGYSSRLEAITYTKESILLYLNSDVSDWPGMMLDRLKIVDIPDENLAARIMVGIPRFVESTRWMTVVIRDNSENTG